MSISTKLPPLWPGLLFAGAGEGAQLGDDERARLRLSISDDMGGSPLLFVAGMLMAALPRTDLATHASACLAPLLQPKCSGWLGCLVLYLTD